MVDVNNIRPITVGTTAPTSPEEGERFFNTNTNELSVFDGAVFQLVKDAALEAALASQANGEGASKVAIEDVAGNTTETEVEGAIAELYSLSAGGDIAEIAATSQDLENIVEDVTNATGTPSTGTTNFPTKQEIKNALVGLVDYWDFCCDPITRLEGAVQQQHMMVSSTLRNTIYEQNLVQDTTGVSAFVNRHPQRASFVGPDATRPGDVSRMRVVNGTPSSGGDYTDLRTGNRDYGTSPSPFFEGLVGARRGDETRKPAIWTLEYSISFWVKRLLDFSVAGSPAQDALRVYADIDANNPPEAYLAFGFSGEVGNINDFGPLSDPSAASLPDFFTLSTRASTTLNQWHNVCITANDKTGEAKWYFDRVLQETANYTATTEIDDTLAFPSSGDGLVTGIDGTLIFNLREHANRFGHATLTNAALAEFSGLGIWFRELQQADVDVIGNAEGCPHLIQTPIYASVLTAAVNGDTPAHQ